MELAPNLYGFFWTSPTANNCNTYLIRSPEKNILIDPGHAPYFDHVRHGLSKLGMATNDIDLVICTHAHPDHLESVRLFTETSALYALHEADWQHVLRRATYLASVLNFDVTRFPPDFFLQEGELRVGEITLEVYHTPGHSPGSVTLCWPALGALFTGDLIFREGLGRTDLPGGNGTELKDSIRRMATVGAELLLPGHGEPVSGARAVKANFEVVEKVWFRYV